MTKQQTVTLNLTKQEAECLRAVFAAYIENYIFGTPNGKPCKPFLNKLNDKLGSATQKINHVK